MADQERPEIAAWLRERGYSDHYVERILKQLDEHDNEAVRQSFFDAMATGEVDLDSIVKDVLGDEQAPPRG